MWRRRADSNRRIGVLQTPALDHLATSPLKVCGAEDETRTHTALAATAPSTLRVYQFHHLGASARVTETEQRRTIIPTAQNGCPWEAPRGAFNTICAPCILGVFTLTSSRDSGQAPSTALRTRSSPLPSRDLCTASARWGESPSQPFDFAQGRLFPSRLGKGSETSPTAHAEVLQRSPSRERGFLNRHNDSWTPSPY